MRQPDLYSLTLLLGQGTVKMLGLTTVYVRWAYFKAETINHSI